MHKYNLRDFSKSIDLYNIAVAYLNLPALIGGYAQSEEVRNLKQTLNNNLSLDGKYNTIHPAIENYMEMYKKVEALEKQRLQNEDNYTNYMSVKPLLDKIEKYYLDKEDMETKHLIDKCRKAFIELNMSLTPIFDVSQQMDSTFFPNPINYIKENIVIIPNNEKICIDDFISLIRLVFEKCNSENIPVVKEIKYYKNHIKLIYDDVIEDDIPSHALLFALQVYTLYKIINPERHFSLKHRVDNQIELLNYVIKTLSDLSQKIIEHKEFVVPISDIIMSLQEVDYFYIDYIYAMALDKYIEIEVLYQYLFID